MSGASAQEQRSRRPQVTPARAVGVLAIVAATGVAAFLLTRPTPQFATERFTNTAGGYSFAYPPSWELNEQGTATTVTSPDARTIISFGIGPDTDLAEASSVFVDSLREQYRQVEFGRAQRQLVARHEALAVNGVGTNRAGARVRFLVITVDGEEKNYSIVVFTAASADPEEILPPAQEIVNSFQPE